MQTPDVEPPGWALINDSELWEAIGQESPNFALIKQLVANAYRRETGGDPGNLDELVQWLRQALMYNDRFPGLVVKRGRLHHAVFASVEDKFETIDQRLCHICLRYPQLPIIRFYLRVPPQSRQVRLQGAFKRAVAEAMAERKDEFAELYDQSLCIAATFVIDKGRKLSDVDNMTKTYLDALQNSVYRNDRQIAHLDAIRLRSRSEETYIATRIMATKVDELDDVIRPKFQVNWVGRKVINLEEYY